MTLPDDIYSDRIRPIMKAFRELLKQREETKPVETSETQSTTTEENDESEILPLHSYINIKEN